MPHKLKKQPLPPPLPPPPHSFTTEMMPAHAPNKEIVVELGSEVSNDKLRTSSHWVKL